MRDFDDSDVAPAGTLRPRERIAEAWPVERRIPLHDDQLTAKLVVHTLRRERIDEALKTVERVASVVIVSRRDDDAQVRDVLGRHGYRALVSVTQGRIDHPCCTTRGGPQSPPRPTASSSRPSGTMVKSATRPTKSTRSPALAMYASAVYAPGRRGIESIVHEAVKRSSCGLIAVVTAMYAEPSDPNSRISSVA